MRFSALRLAAWALVPVRSALTVASAKTAELVLAVRFAFITADFELSVPLGRNPLRMSYLRCGFAFSNTTNQVVKVGLFSS